MDDLADVFSSFGVSNTPQRRQLTTIWEAFSTWQDSEKNVLMNALEGVDQARVYAFYDQFAKLKWK